MYSLMTKPLTLTFYENSGNFYGFAFTALVIGYEFEYIIRVLVLVLLSALG